MKSKIIVSFLVVFLALMLVACGQADNITTESVKESDVSREHEIQMPTIELKKEASSEEESIVVDAVFSGELYQKEDTVCLKLNSPAFFQQADGEVITVSEIYFDDEFENDFASCIGSQIELQGSIILNANPIKFFEIPNIVKVAEASIKPKTETEAKASQSTAKKENDPSEDSFKQKDDIKDTPRVEETVPAPTPIPEENEISKTPDLNGAGFAGAFNNATSTEQDAQFPNYGEDSPENIGKEDNVANNNTNIEGKTYRYYRYYASYIVDEYTSGTISTFSEADALNFIAQEQGTLVGQVYYDEITCNEYMGDCFCAASGNYYYFLG